MQQQTSQESSCHFVFVTDNVLLSRSFPEVKRKLAESTGDYVTLIYYSPGLAYTFRRELENIQHHFPQRLLVYYIQGSEIEPWDSLLETAEVIINSNVKPELTFILTEDEELNEVLTKRLLFLGVKAEVVHLPFLR